jgi:signal transduction histidine kinase
MTVRTSVVQWPWTFIDLAIVTAVVTVAYNMRSGSLPDFAVGVVMSLALLARRQRPMTVMLFVSALAVLQLWVSPSYPTGYDVAIFVAMVTVVIHAERMVLAYVAGGIVLLGTVLVTVESGAGLGTDPGTLDSNLEALVFIVASAGVWAVAFALRTSKLLAQGHADRAATAERERDHLAQLAAAAERAAIARELHDVVAHSLSVMILQADGASYAMDHDQQRARTAMRSIAGTGRDALDDMRRIVGLLRGTHEADGGGERNPVGLDQLAPLVERARSAGLRVGLVVEGERPGLSAADELTIFRLAQEALTNAMRHAGPGAEVTISLTFRDGRAVVEVVDDGAGRTATELRQGAPLGQKGGNGLIGMRERVAVHGGEFDAGPRLDAGWEVRAVVPLKVLA